MFKRIYYNHRNNRIHLWEIDGEKTIKITEEPEIEYYIEDETGKSEQKDIYGTPVKRIVSKTRRDMKEFVDYANVPTCETSLSEDVKYLQKRYAGKTLVPNIDDFNVATIDIENEGSVDAENAPLPINLITVHYSKTNEIYTFGTQEYTGDSKIVKNYHYCASEKVMLEKFIKHFRKQHVDIITGWRVDVFDIPYIINRSLQFEITESLSPINIVNVRRQKDDYDKEKYIEIYQIAGISILDGLKLYKNFMQTKQISYNLNFIGNLECGEGKLDLEGKINEIWKTEWNNFVEYNVQDVLLTKKINDKMKFIDLSINFAYQALIPFDKVFSTISLGTGFILKFLHEKNLVLPDPARHRMKTNIPGGYVMAIPGLYEFLLSFDVESLYPYMIMQYGISPETLVLHPDNITGLIKTPASNLYECETPSGDFSISGIYYKKGKKGVLVEVIEHIIKNRKMFKNKMKVCKGIEDKLTVKQISINTYLDLVYVQQLFDEIKEEGFNSEYYYNQQYILKILANSLYGILNNIHFSLYNAHNAMAITIGGRHLIKFLSETVDKFLKENWHLVAKKYYPELKDANIKPLKNDICVLIDTDSNFLCLDELIKNSGFKFETDEDYRQWTNDFDKRILTPFFNSILKKYSDNFGTEQMINFKREKIITKMMVMSKKHYAALVKDKEGKIYNEPNLEITGLEIVKSSTPKFCKNKLKKSLQHMMEVNDRIKTIDGLRETYNEFLNADINDIAYPRSVRNYTKYGISVSELSKLDYPVHPKGCPQHVKAAINYNFMIGKLNLSLEPIGNGSSIKFIKLNPKNHIAINVIGYIGTYPEEFNEYFKIDYDEQWIKSFQNVIQGFFDVVGWGKVELKSNCIDDFIEF